MSLFAIDTFREEDLLTKDASPSVPIGNLPKSEGKEEKLG